MTNLYLIYILKNYMYYRYLSISLHNRKKIKIAVSKK